MPVVSVIISVYNAAPFIGEAIQSILNQYYNDFELIILNDGSTDNSASVIKTFKDNRIIFIDDNINIGAPARFNQAIKIAKGKYIAHMGADDISLPERLKLQVELMEKNNEIGICGTDVTIFNSKKKLGKWYYPEHHSEIKVRQFFSVGFAHPSVVIRKKILIENDLFYSSTCFPAEDYELWYRLLKVTHGSNIKKNLLLYRISDNQVTATKKELVKSNTEIIRNRYLKDLGIVDENQYKYHTSLINDKWFDDIDFNNKAFAWCNFLMEMNSANKIFDKNLFAKKVSSWAYSKSYEASNKTFNPHKLYKKSSLYQYYEPTIIEKLKLFLRSIFYS